MTVVHCARLIDKLLLRSLQLLRVCSQGAVHDVNRKESRRVLFGLVTAILRTLLAVTSYVFEFQGLCWETL